MEFKKIVIRNYRSIKEIELNFTPNPKFRLTTLIGPGNAGKSNILRSIEILLTRGLPYLSEEDFHDGDTSNPIEFELYFFEPIEYRPWIHSEFVAKIYGISKTRKISAKGETRGQLISVLKCLNLDGSLVLIPKEKPKKDVKSRFEPLLRIPDLVYDRLKILMLPANRDLKAHRADYRRGLLNRILQHVNSKLMDATSDDDGDKGEDTYALFQERSKELYELLRTSSLIQVEEHVNRLLNEFLLGDISFEFDPFSSLDLYEALGFSISEGSVKVSENRTGDGSRMVMLMGICFAYIRLLAEKSVLIIEEPELFLHPHHQRLFYKFLKNEVSRVNYVFLSTHSREFVALEDFVHIRKVEKRDSTKIFSVDQEFDRALLINQSRYPGCPAKDAFFASIVILVEGESDSAALPIYAERLEIDLDRINATIVPVGGKKALRTLARLFHSLGAFVVVCFDKDSKDENLNEELSNLFETEFFSVMLEECFEDEVQKQMKLSAEEWNRLREQAPGKGKIQKAVHFATTREYPIPMKHEELLRRAELRASRISQPLVPE